MRLYSLRRAKFVKGCRHLRDGPRRVQTGTQRDAPCLGAILPGSLCSRQQYRSSFAPRTRFRLAPGMQDAARRSPGRRCWQGRTGLFFTYARRSGALAASPFGQTVHTPAAARAMTVESIIERSKPASVSAWQAAAPAAGHRPGPQPALSARPRPHPHRSGGQIAPGGVSIHRNPTVGSK